MLFREIFLGLRKTWLLSLITIVQIAVGMTLSTVALINESYVSMQSRNYKSLIDDNRHYYETTDFLRGEIENKFFADGEASNNIKAYIEALEASDVYPYYHYGKHSLFMDKRLPDSFDEFYELPVLRDSERLRLRARQINRQVAADYPLRITQGRGFVDSDFTYKEGQTISVLLGADYNGYLQIGEIIDAEYFAVKCKLEIIGFFHLDDYFPLNHVFQYENKSVIMPMQHFPETVSNEQDNKLKQRSYLQYVNGIFALEENQSFAELFHFVNGVKDEFGMFDVIFMQLDLMQAQLLAISANKQIAAIRVICILAFMLSFVMVFISSVSIQRINRRKYAALYLCGASKGNIVSYILGQQLFTVFVACWLYIVLLSLGITGEGGAPYAIVIMLTFVFSAIAALLSLKDMRGNKAMYITKEDAEYGK